MKNRFLSFPVLVLFSTLFSCAANAVTVSLVPDKLVGLDDAGWFAGLVTLNIDGEEYLAMDLNAFFGSIYTPAPSYYDSMWEATLYTRDDIVAGSFDTYAITSEQYAMASQFFLYGLLGYDPADPLWTAGHNEMIWYTLYSDDEYWLARWKWEYASRMYDTETGLTMLDVYTLTYLPSLDPNFDYSRFVQVLHGGPLGDELFLVYTSSVVPVPPAIWLFGSGFIGLVAVARKRTRISGA